MRYLSGSSSDRLKDGTPAESLFDAASTKNIFARIVDRYSISGQQKRIKMGEAYFQAAKRRSIDRLWCTDCKVGKAFRPQHAILTMHVWFLNRRLITDRHNSHQSLLVQEELFDILWYDTKTRIRAQPGINELSVDKHLKDVQNYTFQQCMDFDEAFDIPSSEKKRRDDELGLAIWNNIYLKDDNVPDEFVDGIAKYVAEQHENVVHLLPQNYWTEGRIGFVDIPRMTNKKASPKDLVDDEMEALPDGWFPALTESGESYYWNEQTMNTTWSKPDLSKID
eukprot:CAMPEP_0171301012 /NCGR_PEP_ID=MMETSP0816-20121228/10037_1 /TAXON_ID=420281 /ORGANISM="Proboscia inermis, Strain CCAP1064/1" /LENGTH=279 /DNA_ID=CAMNT_0011778135 /DNA_START=129 /DNA_END=968 /DNA_ORIENTATION=+